MVWNVFVVPAHSLRLSWCFNAGSTVIYIWPVPSKKYCIITVCPSTAGMVPWTLASLVHITVELQNAGRALMSGRDQRPGIYYYFTDVSCTQGGVLRSSKVSWRRARENDSGVWTNDSQQSNQCINECEHCENWFSSMVYSDRKLHSWGMTDDRKHMFFTQLICHLLTRPVLTAHSF